MTLFRTRFTFYIYSCPHIAESANIAENAQYRRIFKGKTFGNIGFPVLRTLRNNNNVREVSPWPMRWQIFEVTCDYDYA